MLGEIGASPINFQCVCWPHCDRFQITEMKVPVGECRPDWKRSAGTGQLYVCWHACASTVLGNALAGESGACTPAQDAAAEPAARVSGRVIQSVLR